MIMKTSTDPLTLLDAALACLSLLYSDCALLRSNDGCPAQNVLRSSVSPDPSFNEDIRRPMRP